MHFLSNLTDISLTNNVLLEETSTEKCPALALLYSYKAEQYRYLLFFLIFSPINKSFSRNYLPCGTLDNDMQDHQHSQWPLSPPTHLMCSCDLHFPGVLRKLAPSLPAFPTSTANVTWPDIPVAPRVPSVDAVSQSTPCTETAAFLAMTPALDVFLSVLNEEAAGSKGEAPRADDLKLDPHDFRLRMLLGGLEATVGLAGWIDVGDDPFLATEAREAGWIPLGTEFFFAALFWLLDLRNCAVKLSRGVLLVLTGAGAELMEALWVGFSVESPTKPATFSASSHVFVRPSSSIDSVVLSLAITWEAENAACSSSARFKGWKDSWPSFSLAVRLAMVWRVPNPEFRDSGVVISEADNLEQSEVEAEPFPLLSRVLLLAVKGVSDLVTTMFSFPALVRWFKGSSELSDLSLPSAHENKMKKNELINN